MTFLELCQKVARDSGTVAGVPSFTTVTAPAGRVAQVVDWVRDAWIDIQNERQDWLFMQKSFTSALQVGVNTYLPITFGIIDFAAFAPDTPYLRPITLYDPALGVADEGAIKQISYELWVQRWGRGSNDNNRPTEWALSPQREIKFGHTPDKAYIIKGYYRRSAQELVLDGDVPIMPTQFHRVIVAEAIRLMARSDEAFTVVQERTDQYTRLRYPLVLDQTPAMDIDLEPWA